MRAFPRVKTRLEWRDIFLDPPRHGRYPLIALLGVLHHIPARARRAALLRALGERLSADGVLIVTFWRFGADPRLRGRTLPWPPAFADQVEANDFLLPWGDVAAGAVRYCHHFDEAEERELVAASGLTLDAILRGRWRQRRAECLSHFAPLIQRPRASMNERSAGSIRSGASSARKCPQSRNSCNS